VITRGLQAMLCRATLCTVPYIVGEDALVALPDEGGQLADGLVVVPPQRLAPLVVIVLDEPPHLDMS
jgi:hypothetical protein